MDVKSWRDKSRRDGGAERGTHTDKDTKKNTQAAKTTNALRVPGALGAAAQTYARCMDKAPLATKAATSAAIFGASDACAQKLERVKEPDATRLLTTTAIGGLYFAPAVLRSAWENASTASRWRRRDAIDATARWREVVWRWPTNGPGAERAKHSYAPLLADQRQLSPP